MSDNNRVRLTTKLAASKETAKAVEGRELEGFVLDKAKAKVLKKVLHNVNVSLGTLISAVKEVSMMRGSEITPDGKLGGKGFIMSFKDIKKILNESVNNLSDVTDTLADELTNPAWGLSPEEKKKVKKEQKQVDTDVEEIDEVEEDQTAVEDIDENDSPVISEEIVEEDVEENSDESEDKVEGKEPDLKEATDEENKYRSLLSSSNDSTAGALSRKIMANLLTGEK